MTDLGILTPHLWLQVQYFDFTFDMIWFLSFVTCGTHHTNAVYWEICTWWEYLVRFKGIIPLHLSCSPMLLINLSTESESLSLWYSTFFSSFHSLKYRRRIAAWSLFHQHDNPISYQIEQIYYLLRQLLKTNFQQYYFHLVMTYVHIGIQTHKLLYLKYDFNDA